jgi:hypothetical protein
MLQVLVPLDAPVPALLPTFGDVVIVQLKGYPSGFDIETLTVGCVISTFCELLAGVSAEKIGG